MVYDDALTIAIISEASARLNISVDACLFEFGRYWIKYAERGSLASIMNVTGQDLASFIENLDRLHLAVGAAGLSSVADGYCYPRANRHGNRQAGQA